MAAGERLATVSTMMVVPTRLRGSDRAELNSIAVFPALPAPKLVAQSKLVLRVAGCGAQNGRKTPVSGQDAPVCRKFASRADVRVRSRGQPGRRKEREPQNPKSESA
jgi:hypothetical protein